jgi:hypothetical protein
VFEFKEIYLLYNFHHICRLHKFCDSIEDESHAILDCFVYDDLRQSLFDKAKTVDNAFVRMSKNEQLIFLFTKTEMIRYCAKTCFNILQRRLLFLYK